MEDDDPLPTMPPQTLRDYTYTDEAGDEDDLPQQVQRRPRATMSDAFGAIVLLIILGIGALIVRAVFRF